MKFRLFDLSLLRVLDALLQERNVTRAAARLHVTQQATSGALRRLREHFDDQLLVRVGRGFQLTPLAATLIGPVREALLKVEQALRTRPDFNPTISERRFTVALSDYVATTLLPGVMARLSEEAPRLVLDVKLIAKTSIGELEKGDLDLCLLPNDWTLFQQETPRDVRSEALYGDDFVCVASGANRSIGDKIEAGDYLGLPHVILKLGDGVDSLVEREWSRLGISPRIAATTTSFASMLFMVSESQLIATVQRRLARRFERMLPIRVLDCPVDIAPLSGIMSWHVAFEDDPAHAYLRRVFAQTAAVSHNPPL